MAVRAVQVDESEKGKPDVQEAVTKVGDLTLTTYVRIERVDDVDGKTTQGVTEIEMLIPVEDEDAEEGDSPYIYNRAVIDLGNVNLKKYLKAIEPFADKSRLVPAKAPMPAPSGASRSKELTEWGHRAKKWLRKAGHEVKDRGRVPAHLEEIYVENNPEDPKPE